MLLDSWKSSGTQRNHARNKKFSTQTSNCQTSNFHVEISYLRTLAEPGNTRLIVKTVSTLIKILEPKLHFSRATWPDERLICRFQSYRKIARQVSTPDSAPAGLGSPQAGIGGLQQHQQQPQQQTQQTLHQADPMQQSKDNLNPAANQQTGALRSGNPPPPVVSMVSTLWLFPLDLAKSTETAMRCLSALRISRQTRIRCPLLVSLYYLWHVISRKM